MTPKRQPTDLRLLVDSAANASLLAAAVMFPSRVPAGPMDHVDADQLRQVLVERTTSGASFLFAIPPA